MVNFLLNITLIRKNEGMSLGYTGKPYDTATGMYNYGYRDYKPEQARFTTVDPIRDGNNWFSYVNNDPVNWLDLWGLECEKASDKEAVAQVNQDKYFLQVAVDLPGEKAREDAKLPVKENVDAGHAFATLIRTNPNGDILESKTSGLYPAPSGGYMTGKDVPGKIVDDWARPRDVEYTMPISEQGYKAASNFIDTSVFLPPNYNLYQHNCVDYVVEIAEKAGVTLPSNTTPTGFKHAMDRQGY